MKEKKYYIVRNKHMLRHEQIFLLWGPKFCGYTTDATKAGQFTLDDVRRKYGDEFPVLDHPIFCSDDKLDNFLIPADKEELGKIGLKKVTVITFS